MNARAMEFTIKGNNQSRAAFQQVRNDVNSLRKSFAAGLGVGILSAELIQLPTLIRGVIAEASTFAKTADLIGLTTNELQELSFGFSLAGVEVGKTEASLLQFSKRLAEAESKGGQLADILEANGVALRGADGQMRPIMALLRDYADLIKRAGSEQEKLSLANEAFGRSGAEFVLALRNGSLGLNRMQGEIVKTGGYLEEELQRRAEEIDDKFARLWRTFELSGKRAVLSVAALMDDVFLKTPVDASLKDLQKGLTSERQSLSRQLSFLERSGSQAEIDAMRNRLEAVDARLAGIMRERAADAFGTSGPLGRGGKRGKIAETIIPTKGGEDGGKGGGASRAASNRARLDQISQTDRILNQLREEASILGLSALEQRKVNALKMAGVDATSEQGRAIAALIDQIQNQNEAQSRLNEVTGYFGGIASSQIGSFVQQLGFADNAAGRLAATLAEAALQAALLGQGPLAGIMGGGGLLPKLFKGFGGGFGGGVGSTLADAFAGMYADGGTLGAGQWGIAGEAGPEIVTGPAKVVSNRDSFGGKGGERPIVYMTVYTQDAESFRRSETQITGQLVDALGRGQRGR
ncbi:hypothetical protein [Roseibium sediminis]|uniref:hypothetical protein n=1 Tax=Roseibium sediminis TaxID=1775174 RepID=UPI00123C8A15|nr:hypothetical protein [Roseibium sediminis]